MFPMFILIQKLIMEKKIYKKFRKIFRDQYVIIGSIVVSLLLLISLFAPAVAPNSPIEQNLEERLLPPTLKYPFGTDNLGRCIFSRIIYGARISLSIGVIVIGINSISGVIIGLIAGYFGKAADSIIMRLVDIFLSLPGIIIALLIAAIIGPSLLNIMLALSIIGWTGYARVVRSSVLSAKEKEFIKAEISIGASHGRIIFYHILPNVVSPVLVMMTLGMGYTILAISALSFIGLGAQPPLSEWGAMLNSGRPFMQTAPHLMIFPGLAIMISVLGFNFLGNGLRGVLF